MARNQVLYAWTPLLSPDSYRYANSSSGTASVLPQLIPVISDSYQGTMFLDTLRHMITAPVLTFEKLTAAAGRRISVEQSRVLQPPSPPIR
jgi:hypothetical protein